jgi:hypothetical protein
LHGFGKCLVRESPGSVWFEDMRIACLKTSE